MSEHNMEYNSQKPGLVMPEYGRNVQIMIDYAKQLDDKEFRQAFTEKIVDLMMIMNPQNKNVENYRLKLWKHLLYIAQGELDVIPPDTVDKNPELRLAKPEQVEYPQGTIRFRHYGKGVQELIKKVQETEDPDKKLGLAHATASYMKMAYRTWNKEHNISDEAVINDLRKMSKGEIDLEGEKIENLMEGQQNSSGGSSRRKGRNSKKYYKKGNYKNRRR